MTNDMIGIAGVLVAVFVLFLIRYFVLNVGRGKERRLVGTTTHRTSAESKKRSDEDDSWLLWAAGADQTDSPTRVRDELAERRARAERKGSSQQL